MSFLTEQTMGKLIHYENGIFLYNHCTADSAKLRTLEIKSGPLVVTSLISF